MTMTEVAKRLDQKERRRQHAIKAELLEVAKIVLADFESGALVKEQRRHKLEEMLRSAINRAEE